MPSAIPEATAKLVPPATGVAPRGDCRPGRACVTPLSYVGHFSALRAIISRKMSPRAGTAPWRRRITSAMTPVQPVW